MVPNSFIVFCSAYGVQDLRIRVYLTLESHFAGKDVREAPDAAIAAMLAGCSTSGADEVPGSAVA